MKMVDPAHIIRNFPGLTNYVVPIKGSTVTCYLGVRDAEPNLWIYSLWTGRDGQPGDTKLLVTGELDLTGLTDVTAEQVANAAFLLEIEYKDN